MYWGSVQAVRPIGGVKVYLYSFMINGTRRGWGVSVTARPLFTPGEDPVPIVQEAGWAPGPVWTGAENLAPTGIRFPDRPARSQSLYWVCYPAHLPHTSISKLSNTRVSNPWPARLCHAARNHICAYFINYKKYSIIQEAGYTTYCNFHTCRPQNSPL